MENEAVWAQIDTSEYLYLSKLFEPRDNALTVILSEAISNEASVQRARESMAKLPEPLNLGDAKLIESTPDCSVFTLHWKDYVSYCVTEEMHGSCGDYQDESYTGRLLRVYSKSHFLDFVARDTGAHFHPYRHYKIACLNHVIDIVSAEEPEISWEKNRNASASMRIPVGAYKTFGETGPLYQVRGPAAPTAQGEMVSIVLIPGGERLDYPLADMLEDPTAS